MRLYSVCEAFCVAAAVVPVARDAVRWTAVRLALARVGEATPRSIIWRFAGGGWPYGSSRRASAWERAFLTPLRAAEAARNGELATLGLLVERGILLAVDMAEGCAGAGDRDTAAVRMPSQHAATTWMWTGRGGVQLGWDGCRVMDGSEMD